MSNTDANPAASAYKPIEEGIALGPYGYRATVRVRPYPQKEKRFPRDTALSTIRLWRANTESDLRGLKEVGAEAPKASGTYAFDMERFKLKIKDRDPASYNSDCSHLKAWIPALGTLLRKQITTDTIRPIVVAWREAGVAPKTIRHRLRVLRELYEALDGAYARSPTKGIKNKIPDSFPVTVTQAEIEAVYQSLKRGLRVTKAHGPIPVGRERKVTFVDVAAPEKTAARFLVRAATGVRPGQLMLAVEDDISFERKVWTIRPLKGGKTIHLPLTPFMEYALQEFIAADAFGDFDTPSFSKTVKRHGWPEDKDPYVLRHTRAMEALDHGAGMEDVQEMLGHKQITTTQQHYGRVSQKRLTKVLGGLDTGKLSRMKKGAPRLVKGIRAAKEAAQA